MSDVTLRGSAPAVGEFDESWFEEGTKRRRGRWIALFGLGVVAVLVGLAVWNWQFRGGGEAAVADQVVAARLGTISDTIETNGTVASQSQTSLSFEGSGEVESVNVKLGQEVKKDDVLATLDAPALEDAVRRAEISLYSAQLQLNDLLKGADASELSQADESYLRAVSTLETAQNALDDLRAGPTASDISAAQQKVYDAEAALARAQEARTALDSTTTDAVDKAEADLNKAEQSETTADRQLTDAENALDVAEAQLEGAEAAYCPDGGVSFCGSSKVPLPASDMSALLAVASGDDVDRARLANAVLDASTTYDQRATAVESAEDALSTAQDSVNDAEDALNDAQAGPTAGEIKSADADVSSAQLALSVAQSDLADVQDGADADEIRVAELEVTSAEAGLTSADAQRDEAYAGADSDEISNQQGQVELAQLSLDEANRDLEQAQIIAPFDGSVADLNIKVGDSSGGSASGSTGDTSAAIILNTPDALVIELAIAESDLASVKVGQTGTVSFDQLDGATYPITLDAIGTNPTTTQGVTTYEAVATVDLSSPVATLPNGAALPEGFTPPDGVDIPDDIAARFQQARGGAADGEQAKPAPGMTGTVTITIDEQTDVIVVPSNAIQQDGPQQVVEIETETGERQRLLVETGLSNGTQTAITAGLEEGEMVVVPAATAGGTTNTGQPPAGGFQFGGGPGGGGPGGGGPGGNFAGPGGGGQ